MGLFSRILGRDHREPLEHPAFGRLQPTPGGWEGEIDFTDQGHASDRVDVLFEGRAPAGPTPTQVEGLSAFLESYGEQWGAIRDELERMVETQQVPWGNADRRLDFHAPSISVRPAPPSESPIISLQYTRSVADGDYGYFVDLCDGVVVDSSVVD